MSGWRIFLIIPRWLAWKGPIEETLKRPALVIQSVSDETARLYYRFYSATRVGDKFVCVAVKVTGSDGFVLTAYLTDKPKKGLVLWDANS